MGSTGKHNDDDRHDTAPRRGDQTQGGIGHETAEKAQREHDPSAGVPNGPQGGKPVRAPGPSPREDSDEDEATGFKGDDGQHVPADTSAQAADLAPEQAIAPEGGVGGRSGTGQAKTHRPFDDSTGKQALGQAAEPGSELPEPRADADYQSGGTRGDRAQRVEERKVQEPGGGAPRNPTGAADPAPGSQPGRYRTPGDRW